MNTVGELIASFQSMIFRLSADFANGYADLGLEDLAWLIPIIHIIHYAEEGPRLVSWFRNHQPVIIRGRALEYTQQKLNLENLILLLFSFLIVVLFNIFPDSRILQAAILGGGIGFLGNAYFHIKPTLIAGVYSPGVVTAAMLFPATAITLFAKAAQTGALTPLTIALAFPLGLTSLPIAVILTHTIILAGPRK